MSWIDCVADNDYEIFETYPHQIRKKSNQRIITETLKPEGYIIVGLNGKTFGKHQVIALQWIQKDDPNKTEVDHINHIKTDNRIENLRWVTHQENDRNRSHYRDIVYEFFDELPEDSIEITNHCDHLFHNYYMGKDGNVYFFNGVKYRKLYVDKRNSVNMFDIWNVKFNFSINRLRKAFL